MKTSLKIWFSLLPVAITAGFFSWAIALNQLGRLPNPVATHWSIAGVADGFASLETHLVWSLLAFGIPALIWLFILWYPKIPGVIRLVMLGISGILFAIMALIQFSALAIQVDISDAALARFEIPVLVIFVPIVAMLFVFLAKPKVTLGADLSISLRGIPMFRTGLEQISSVSTSHLDWRDFGGLGLRISRGRIAFLPNPGPALEIHTRAGETILVRSDEADLLAAELKTRMGQ